MRKGLLFVLFVLVVCSEMNAQVVSTIAGSAGLSGTTNGIGSTSRFNNPHGITADNAGNIYIADRYNNLIRKITPSGIVSTLAGTGAVGSTDGAGNIATFNEPWGVACDTLGNIYVADTKNYKIRKIDSGGNVTTFAGAGTFGTTNGANNVAKFGFPTGITITPDGNTIYVSDYNTHVIRKISGGQVTTFAGTIYIAGANDGSGLAATFNHPYNVQLDNNGNILVADEWNNIIRKISPAAVVNTFAGQGIAGSINGTALSSQFNYPWDIAVDNLNNIYVLDGYNFTVRKIATSGTVTTYVGTPGVAGAADGTGAAAQFDNAAGITYNAADHSLYVADCNNNTIRRITSQSSIIIALTVTGSTTVCFGDSIHFNASPSGLSNYTIKEGSTILGNSVNGIISIAALPKGAHTFTCTAYDSNGAAASSNAVSVTVLDQFIPAVSPNVSTSVCQGDSVKITAQSGSSYQWSNGSSSQYIFASVSGSYFVTVTGSDGCKGHSNPVQITIQSAPVATINSSANSVCPGDSVQLTASAATSWKWSNGAITQSVKVPAGNYEVTVTNVSGCSAKSSTSTITNYTVTIPSVTPPGPITIIQGDSVQLIASGGSNFLWSNAATGNAVYIKTSGSYFVNATSTNGCVVPSIAVQVNVISASSLMTATGATNFCEGNNVLLNSAAPSGNQWFYNGLAINGATNQSYVATDSGYYKVAISTSSGVLFSDSILVTVFTTPQLASVQDTNICSGSSVDFHLTHQNNVDYGWYDVDTGGNALAITDNFHTPSIINLTTYYIESIGSNGCVSDRTALKIIVLPTPVSDFATIINPQNGLYPTTFNNKSLNADSYTWIFGDTTTASNISHDANPIFNYQSIGNYTVVLISSNQNGCADTLARMVNIHSNNALFIPTTFTPNGDGKNDIFRVRGDKFTFQEMKIYDQWGSLIYHSDASLPQWDGRVNGENVQNGTYVYKITIIDETNISKVLTGSVTVIK